MISLYFVIKLVAYIYCHVMMLVMLWKSLQICYKTLQTSIKHVQAQIKSKFITRFFFFLLLKFEIVNYILYIIS